MMERLVRWIRAAVKPDIDEAFAKPAPLAEEDVAMIKSLIAAVEAMKKVQVDQAARLRALDGTHG